MKMLITKETANHSESSQDQRSKAWWKNNCKKVVAGLVVIGGTILVIKNWDEIVVVAEKLAATFKLEAKTPPSTVAFNVVEKTDVAPIIEMAKEVMRKTPEATFDVNTHVRTLPEGWHASPEKLAEAAELQIVLLPNQTLVDAYTKSIKVA